eukprot:CAMPEP_0119054128 /NCGR_PEP_ID=MMETSP1177-20130426/74864_1 /TAXON_ID=2985 /ORGANISM="Ochromonas sp, Strain CCMP1899" /LENGTH=244 /DNA_ID=CAMNT_0007034263 /DNA_START=706 /DNA_END=1437 /DNA_ORIENTATION=-
MFNIGVLGSVILMVIQFSLAYISLLVGFATSELFTDLASILPYQSYLTQHSAHHSLPPSSETTPSYLPPPQLPSPYPTPHPNSHYTDSASDSPVFHPPLPHPTYPYAYSNSEKETKDKEVTLVQSLDSHLFKDQSTTDYIPQLSAVPSDPSHTSPTELKDVDIYSNNSNECSNKGSKTYPIINKYNGIDNCSSSNDSYLLKDQSITDYIPQPNTHQISQKSASLEVAVNFDIENKIDEEKDEVW